MKEAYYFSHDANARHDPKIVAMMARYGVEGYGRYWIIIEMLREDADHRLQIGSVYMRNALAVQMQCDPDAALNFVQDCITEFELFETDDDYFWSNSLLRRMDMRKARSDQARRAAQARWDGKKKPKKEKKNADAMRQHSVSNATAMQLKESKLNIKESTSTPPIPPPSEQCERIKTDDNNVNKDLKKIIKAFEADIHLLPSSTEVECLAGWLDDGMDPDLIVFAIKQAAWNSARKISYIDAVLRNLKAENITSLKVALERERDRKQAQQAKQSGQGESRAREPTLPPLSPEDKKRNEELIRKLAEEMSLDVALENKTDEEVPPWLSEQETG